MVDSAICRIYNMDCHANSLRSFSRNDGFILEILRIRSE